MTRTVTRTTSEDEDLLSDDEESEIECDSESSENKEKEVAEATPEATTNETDEKEETPADAETFVQILEYSVQEKSYTVYDFSLNRSRMRVRVRRRVRMRMKMELDTQARMGMSEKRVKRGLGLSEGAKFTFTLRRTPTSSHRFSYTAVQFAENPSQARQCFVIHAVKNQVQKRLYSWRYFQARFSERRRSTVLLEAAERSRRWITPGTGLDSAETQELLDLKRDFETADARFYNALVIFKLEYLAH